MLLLHTCIDTCVRVQASVWEKEARHGQPPAPALSSLIKDSRRGGGARKERPRRRSVNKTGGRSKVRGSAAASSLRGSRAEPNPEGGTVGVPSGSQSLGQDSHDLMPSRGLGALF